MAKPVLNDESTSLGKSLHAFFPFIVGCGSGMIATTCTQPIDTIKVRMQLMEKTNISISPWSVAKKTMTQDGLSNLYQGLSAGLLRQLVYGTLRLGLFSNFERVLDQRAHDSGTTLGFSGRALAAVSAGAIAALAGNPTEVALIRMQADGLKPAEQRTKHRNVFVALGRIARVEGILALWKGSAPTIVRAVSTNFGQLAFFSESKHQIQKYSSMSAQKRTTLAAAIAGFVGAFISLPFDFIKTRLQNQSMVRSTDSLPAYKGTWDCLSKVIQREGPLRFYRDFWPYFMRIAPHSIISLFLVDQITQVARGRGKDW